MRCSPGRSKSCGTRATNAYPPVVVVDKRRSYRCSVGHLVIAYTDRPLHRCPFRPRKTYPADCGRELREVNDEAACSISTAGPVKR
jgi:hypothetical protein